MKSGSNIVVDLLKDSLYDESGVMCYEYGNMGEVTKETRIYALPFLSQPLALSTLFEYDSWGRILNITYPDNEIVSYDYDLGGQLERMYNNSSYNYLDNIIYDKFGAKTSQDYGNGIVTQYTYNDTTRRLSEIATNNGALINYTYDLVGNVTQVTSICPWLQNQSFTESFSYDSADQLTTAQENQNNGYQLTVNYGHWGKVNNYDLAQTDFINNTSTGDSRLFTYPSDPNNLQVAQTMFAPEQCNGTADILFSFGINGSLRKRETMQPQQHTEYYLFNSQGNLKAYSDDVMSFAYYGYNAANTRTYKLSLYNTNLWINGQQQPLNLQWQNAMFYPNTYLNFDAFGNYTKHYYNGMERVASRLGDNTTTIALNNNILEARKLQLEEQFREDIHKLIYETVPIDMPPFIDVNTLQPTGTPNDIYYYHPNHLGNTAFVTDQNQTITQGFLYAPFGEITTEYNINFGNNVIPKYSFNAKELDEENGMYYYEARYYAPPTFTSRDPLFEKYFWMSPYAYCANNPVKYVDPDGKTVVITGECAEIATNTLSTKNITVTRDPKSGKLSVDGKAKNRNERLLVKAINSEDVIVKLTVKNSEIIEQDKEENDIMMTKGGSFMGNTLNYNEKGIIISATASQYVSINALNDNYDKEDHGAVITHEITEGYIGGRISIRMKEEAPAATQTSNKKIYNRAHNRAASCPLSKEQKRQLQEEEAQYWKEKSITPRPNIRLL